MWIFTAIGVVIVSLFVLRLAFSLGLRALLRKVLGTISEDQKTGTVSNEIRLIPAPDAEWDGLAIKADIVAVETFGYKRLRAYTVDMIPNLIVYLFLADDQKSIAVVYKMEARVWCDFVAYLPDQKSICATNAPQAGNLEAAPWVTRFVGRGLVTPAIYGDFLFMCKEQALETVTEGEVVARFEAAYKRETEWRKNKGVSVEEVKNVAGDRDISDEELAVAAKTWNDRNGPES